MHAPPTHPRQDPFPDYWLAFEAYHRVREPLYREILHDLALESDGWVLDAGCGDGFYSRLLAERLGSRARVLAVDLDPAMLRANLSPPRVHRLQTNVDCPALRDASVCAVWVSRAMFSAPDPPARLAALARLIRPGGTLAVIENDFPHHPIVSFPEDFEHRLVEARFRFLESDSPEGWSPDRYRAAAHLPAWLERAGLRNIRLRTHVSDDVAPMSPELEDYWRLMMVWQGRLLRPFLDPDDWSRYARAVDPASDDYVLRRPGFHLMELTTVGWGVK